MTNSDVNQVVAIHLVAFENFFLSFLGEGFLRVLYQAILVDPTGITFVYSIDNSMVGFVIGTTQISGLYSRLIRQHWWQFGFACIKPVVKKTKIVPRLLRALNKPHEAILNKNMGTLMSIAVLPNMQGLGIGEALVQAFVNEARYRGLSYVNLTTDHDNNDKVNYFYLRLGFRCTRTFITSEERKMNEYMIDIL